MEQDPANLNVLISTVENGDEGGGCDSPNNMAGAPENEPPANISAPMQAVSCVQCGHIHVAYPTAIFCVVCGYCCIVNPDHLKSIAHIRRQVFQSLKRAWEEFENADLQGKKEFHVHRIIDILSSRADDGRPLFHLGPKTWPAVRVAGPEYFRRLKLADEIKREVENIIEKLKPFFSVCAELKMKIDMLKLPLQVRPVCDFDPLPESPHPSHKQSLPPPPSTQSISDM